MSGSDDTDRARAWIRVRGAPDDPESWDLGSWNGLAWEVHKDLPNGRRVVLHVRDYMVAERLSSKLNPVALYRTNDEDRG